MTVVVLLSVAGRLEEEGMSVWGVCVLCIMQDAQHFTPFFSLLLIYLECLCSHSSITERKKKQGAEALQQLSLHCCVTPSIVLAVPLRLRQSPDAAFCCG